jgi:hypothetical protein
MNQLPTMLCLIAAALVCRCKEKPVSAPVTPAVQQQIASTRPEPFVPPADSAISTAQIQAWSRCNPLLDSLTFRYADSFKTTDPAATIRYQDDFITAQDRICVKAGLAGGYKEYKWILQYMGIEKNRSILQSANAQSF